MGWYRRRCAPAESGADCRLAESHAMNKARLPRSAAQQRGVALVIVLILLLVMTLLGLASMRGTLLEERMSGNLFDRSLAFQAAEAALRPGEALGRSERRRVGKGGVSSGESRWGRDL